MTTTTTVMLLQLSFKHSVVPYDLRSRPYQRCFQRQQRLRHDTARLYDLRGQRWTVLLLLLLAVAHIEEVQGGCNHLQAITNPLHHHRDKEEDVVQLLGSMRSKSRLVGL